MDITPLIPTGKKIIKGYGDGAFRINEDERYEGDIVITSQQVMPVVLKQGDEVSLAPETIVASLNALKEDIEIVLLGMGSDHQPVTEAIRTIFRERGIALESMSTGAACRTYNVLLSEGRQVAAILVAV